MPNSSEERGVAKASAVAGSLTRRSAVAVGAAFAVAVVVVVVVVAVSAWASDAQAQQQPEGFAVERFYPAAPGGGWMVMDDLGMRGGLGGVIGISSGYARKPLQIRTSDGSQHLTVVSDQAFADVGIAVTYDRYRLYFNLDGPLSVRGESRAIGSYQLTAPSVTLGSNPDTAPRALSASALAPSSSSRPATAPTTSPMAPIAAWPAPSSRAMRAA
jgi:hypothetical protein